MASSDNLHLNNPKKKNNKDPRPYFFKRNSNRTKIINGNAQEPGVSSPAAGSNLLGGPSSSRHSGGGPPRTWSPFGGIQYTNIYCVGESSQGSNPVLVAESSGRDLTASMRSIQVESRTVLTQTQQYQSDNKIIKMNKDAAPLVKRHGGIDATPVSRPSKWKEKTTRPSKDSTSSFKRTGTGPILESKQLTLKEPTQSLKDLSRSAERSAFSRIFWAALPFWKKKETIQPPQSATNLVDNGGTSTILASKHLMESPKHRAELFKNIVTSQNHLSMHSMQKRETAQPPKHPARLDKNIGTSRILTSIHSMQEKKMTQPPKVSAVWVKKSGTSSKSPTLTQSTQKKESTPSSEGPAGMVNKRRGGRTLLPNQVTQKQKREAISAERVEEHRFCKDHIVWEGFSPNILRLEKSCFLCEGDLATEPNHDPDIVCLNPAETAVLPCDHVFHNLCLQLATSEENSRDPPCEICGSTLS